MTKSKRKQESGGAFWRYLLNFWTIVLFAFIIADFIKDNALAAILSPLAVIYAGLLAIYSAEKEFERWHFYHLGRHPGEIYVIVWTVLIVGLFVAEFVLRSSY
ncbi:hypothetical protein KW785_00810, partial [Candidatus Parcubacteria bacterium]|nr:hypothetical protein [Candidatus Parcubacteria bacterium]